MSSKASQPARDELPARRPRRARTSRRRRSSASRRGRGSTGRARPSKRPRWLVWALLVVLAVAGSALAVLLTWALLPGPGEGKPVEVEVPENLTPGGAGELLRDAGLIDSPHLLAAYLVVMKPAVTLEPGWHFVTDQMSPKDLVQRLARLSSRPVVKLTVVEGWHHLQLAERLHDQRICSRARFVEAARDAALLRELGIRGTSAEGYLFPATYELSVNTDSRRLLRQLVTETRRRIARLDRKHDNAVAKLAETWGWSEHDILTLASMVEKEAVLPKERPLIASVFFNRLSNPEFKPRRMLQSDPTAAYGCIVEPELSPACSTFDGRVRPAMLRDGRNRYNTYRHAGLPPGPIANPGEASIEAVLAPAESDYLYFVARGGGGHTFSHSFEQHRQAIDARRGTAR